MDRATGEREQGPAESVSYERDVPTIELGQRFADAFRWAGELHAHQRRKGSGVPYVSHLLAVASLVLEDGGSEDEAIAALLHDAVEDQGEAAPLSEIERRYGPRVAGIVDACTDADRTQGLSSKDRKRMHLEHLRGEDDRSVRRVVLADKLHNARAIVRDLETHGDEVWKRFNTGPDVQLGYYRELARILDGRDAGPMGRELGRLVDRMESLTPDVGPSA